MSLSRAFIAASLACVLAGCGSANSPTSPTSPTNPGPSASYALRALDAPVVIGATAQLRAVQVNTDGTTIPVPDSVAKTWTSSDTAVARVDAQGILTGVTAGVTTIGLSVSGVTASLPVAVQAGTYRIVGLDTPLPIGSSLALHASVNLANGSTLNVSDAVVTWSSSNAGVARVDAQGVITAVSEGSATIAASFNGGTATSQVARVMAIRYRISGLPGVLVADDKLTLRALMEFTDGSTQPATHVTWSTSKPNIANVDAVSGLLTAVTDGTVEVSFAVDGQPAVTDATRVVRNLSGGWTLAYVRESCVGSDCPGPTGTSTVTMTQSGLTLSGKNNGIPFTGTIEGNGSVSLSSVQCRAADSGGTDVLSSVSEWNMPPDGNGFAGRGRMQIQGSFRTIPVCSGTPKWSFADGILFYTLKR